LHYFRDKARYWSKIVIFYTPLHSTAPYSGPCRIIAIPFGTKTRMVGLPDGKKSMRICSAASTMPACDRRRDRRTDGQTDSLPRRSPRYAYASRSKNDRLFNRFDMYSPLVRHPVMGQRTDRNATAFNAVCSSVASRGKKIGSVIRLCIVCRVYRCWLHRHRAERCCERVGRPTHDSTDRRSRPAVRHGSASSTALDLLADTVTHRRMRRSDKCTADCSSA